MKKLKIDFPLFFLLLAVCMLILNFYATYYNENLSGFTYFFVILLIVILLLFSDKNELSLEKVIYDEEPS